MSLSSANENENEFTNEKLSQDDESQLRFSQSNSNTNNSSFKSTSNESSGRVDSVESSAASKNVDRLDNTEKTSPFALTRLNEQQQIVQSIVDQNNNEFFGSGEFDVNLR